MLKKLILSAFFILGLFIAPPPAFAANQVDVYFFWGSGCPHCAKEKPFLETLEKKYQTLTVHKYEVWYSEDNRKLLVEVGSQLKSDVRGVPFTVVGEKQFSGYLDDQTTGKEIEAAIQYCLHNQCKNPVGEIITKADSVSKPSDGTKVINTLTNTTIPEKISVPIIGDVTIKNLSLPVLTLVIAALDGFNPCAMWALIFLLSLLIGMHDRQRMWILGGTFIVTSAVVYFLFMAAWLHLILFIGFIFWVRLLIGILGIGGGIYNLREYLVNKDNACKVTNTHERQRIFSAAKQFTREKNFWIAMGGIIIIAAAVNLIEMICSAGLPVIYTQVLALSNLPVWQYYLYLLFYILIFMFDDLVVFIIAMKTLEISGITTKYSRLSHLIGGVLMVLIGLLLLFKPELLMFG